MAEKLTKAAIKSELQRRIDWLERAHKFKPDHNDLSAMADKPQVLRKYGVYVSLKAMLWQVENNLFIGGWID